MKAMAALLEDPDTYGQCLKGCSQFQAITISLQSFLGTRYVGSA